MPMPSGLGACLKFFNSAASEWLGGTMMAGSAVKATPMSFSRKASVSSISREKAAKVSSESVRHVERHVAGAGNLVEDRGVGRGDASGGHDEVVAEGEVVLPAVVHEGDEARRRRRGVVPERKVDGARMRGLTLAPDAAVHAQSADARHEAHATVGRSVELEALLNVHLQKRRNPAGVKEGLSRREGRGIDPAAGEPLGERRAVRREAAFEVFGLELSKDRRGAHEPLLLAADDEHAEVALEPDAVFLEPKHGAERRGNAGEPVVVAAVENAVGVAP